MEAALNLSAALLNPRTDRPNFSYNGNVFHTREVGILPCSCISHFGMLGKVFLPSRKECKLVFACGSGRGTSMIFSGDHSFNLKSLMPIPFGKTPHSSSSKPCQVKSEDSEGTLSGESIILNEPAITKAIEKQIKANFEKADGFAYSIYREVEKAKATAKQNPEQASNMYQQYVNAFQKKMTEKKQKAEKAKEKAKDTNVNVALTQQDSMFKDIALPGGISTKATEYKDLAAKGNRWESPVFGIGSARESTNLPSVSKVTRKPHQTRSAGVRGGNHPNANTSSSSQGAGTSGRGYDSGNTGAGYDTGYGSGQTGAGYGSTGQQGSGYDIGYGSGQTGAGYGTTGQQGYGTTGQQGYGSTGQQGYGTSALGGQNLGGTSGAGSGLNREMDQAFRTTGQTGGAGNVTSGTLDDGRTTTFYDSATR